MIDIATRLRRAAEEAFSTSCGASTVAQEPPKPLTLETIKRAIAAIPKDLVAEYMKEKGFDPADGCLLIMPISMRRDRHPDYIRWSPVVAEPVMLKNPMMFPRLPEAHQEVER